MAETLTIKEREGFGLATVMARAGVEADAVGVALNLAAPAGPSVVRGETLALIGTGPGTWLALADHPPAGWPDDIGARLRSLASVSDQSGGYRIFRVSGNGARTLLQRGASIDFHPQSFAAGSVAVTVIAHIGVIIWQIDDQPSYDVAIFRSFGTSFRRWLQASCANL